MTTVEILCLMLQITLPLCTANIQTSILWKDQSGYCIPDQYCSLPQGPDATVCCGLCNCEEDCTVYGLCCLHLYTDFQHGERSVRETRYECTRSIIDYSGMDVGLPYGYRNETTVWMVARCSPFNVDYDAQTLCENPGINNSLESVVPVTDYKVHYRNKFCAICNGIEESKPLLNWGIRLVCQNEITYNFWTVLAKAKDNNCRIHLHAPDLGKPAKSCRLQPYEISSCNLAGLWSSYNETIELACNAYVDSFKNTYKNIFCYMCNTEEFVPPANSDCPSVLIDFVYVPFSVVLDVNALKTTEIQDKTLDGIYCDSDHFRDEKKGICRKIFCNASRTLVDQECVLRDGWHCITMFIKLTPENPNMTNNFFNISKSQGSFAITQLLLNREWHYVCNSQHYYFYPSYSILQIFFMMNVDLVPALIRKLHQTSNLLLDDVSVFSEIISSNYVLTDDKLTVAIPNENTNTTDILESYIEQSNKAFTFCKKMLFKFPVFDLLHFEPIIQLNSTELNMKIVDEAFLVIEESFMKKRFSRWEFRHKHGKILITLSTYISIYNAMPVPTITEDADVNSLSKTNIKTGVKEYIAFVCVCLSIICLTITVLIFLIHKELQSQPGINTVILSVSLLLAQAMYQFGAGQTTVPHWACALIGALCHFFWLAVMFSMNACSVGMFLAFRNLKRIPPRYNKAQTTKTIIYIAVFSLAFVLINIVYSVIDSRGQSFGYGDNICYFSSFWMQLITFIAPSLIMVLLNITLFVCVVIFISKTVPRDFNFNRERNFFAIYFRLSTLTGLTWLIGFLQLIIKSDILEYFFIILNGSQGVFIMVTFV